MRNLSTLEGMVPASFIGAIPSYDYYIDLSCSLISVDFLSNFSFTGI